MMHKFETGASDLTFNVTTRYSADLIEQEVSNGREVNARQVCHLQDEGVKKALAELGYLSPEEAESLRESLHSSRQAYEVMVGAQLKADAEHNKAERKIYNLKKEWENWDISKVSVGQKLEALIDILYSN